MKQRRRIGLARTLSKLGYCSRSAAVQLVRDGRVSVNGAILRDPEWPCCLEMDRIAIDGRAVAAAAKIYLMLNKPRGTVTTASDEKGRKTVYADLGDGMPWVGPVGRLDKASEGLLLLTNDSEWAARVLAPETHLDKVYHVQISVVADDALLKHLCGGIETRDGDVLRVKSARMVRIGEKNSWVEIVLDEGKNRHIRRMFAALSIEVLRLVRVAIGPLALGKLPKGASRQLTRAEKRSLDDAMCGRSSFGVASFRRVQPIRARQRS
ncbi:MAG: rRNA pseudouridine synthase [Acidobacteriia bacterium]|nr:rRNA pseudouridine synthase [Terriglobia bacterium]